MRFCLCVSVRWVTWWVRSPCENMCVRSLGYIVGAFPPCENKCVRLLGYIVGAPPPCENMCVCSLGYIVGASASPLCVSVQLVTLWERPPLVCVLSLEDNLRRILACCLLRFATFFIFNPKFVKHNLNKTNQSLPWAWHIFTPACIDILQKYYQFKSLPFS